MTPGLMDALREALACTSDTDPRDMTLDELAILDRLDDQIADLLDALMDGGECAAEARACIQQAMRRPS